MAPGCQEPKTGPIPRTKGVYSSGTGVQLQVLAVLQVLALVVLAVVVVVVIEPVVLEVVLVVVLVVV